MGKDNSYMGKTDKKGAAAMLACYILFGVFPVFWKLLSDVDSFYVVSSRVFWSVVFCFLIALFMGNLPEVRKVLADKKQMKYLAWAGLMLGINWTSYIVAVNSGQILDASLAYYLNPLLTIGLGRLIFKEKLVKQQWIALGIAASGILAAIAAYGAVPYFALLMAGSYAVYSVIKKKVLCTSIVSTLVEALVLSPFAILYMAVTEFRGAGAAGELQGAALLLLPVAGIVTAVPLLFFSYGITRVTLALSGILMYINPTLQFLIGVLLYGEKFDWARGIMFTCVWIAIAVFVRAGGKRG